MKIAIHHKQGDFSSKWIEYCQAHKIDHKIVNCYDNNIVSELEDCDALMWHFHHANPKDVLFAKQLIYSLQTAGKKVFPDFHTAWHFDDKVGQKYLLESVEAPLVPSYVFFEKSVALDWVRRTEFPKVFKLRTGSGSAHVKLVKKPNDAKRLINQAFGIGFSQYDKFANLRERWTKYKIGKVNFKEVLKGIVRLGYTTNFAKVAGRERGYIYFQDFIPDNNFDNRVIVIDGKACAIKRKNRENDFRASGSGILSYDKENFSEKMIKQSFKIAEAINSKSLAIDYVFKGREPMIVELSYGFPSGSFVDDCPGYWDRELNWHPGPFDAQGWMVESLLDS